jgi:hypothetical protein
VLHDVPGLLQVPPRTPGAGCGDENQVSMHGGNHVTAAEVAAGCQRPWVGSGGVQLRYRYRLYPPPGQRSALARAFGCARVVFNDGLAARQEAHEAGRPYLTNAELSAQLTAAKATPGTQPGAWHPGLGCGGAGGRQAADRVTDAHLAAALDQLLDTRNQLTRVLLGDAGRRPGTARPSAGARRRPGWSGAP